MIVVVSATRLTSDDFFTKSLLGLSLSHCRNHPHIRLRIFFENTVGLGAAYNAAISEAQPDDILVFVHDDVLLLDYLWPSRILWGLQTFDILGVAGNIRRVPKQPCWWLNERGTRDDPQYLSGVVAHGNGLPFNLSVFGQTFQHCKLLDGLFLVTKKTTLASANLRFDPQFDFHFYDMDFCRQAEILHVSMGTLPLAIMHASRGARDISWKENWERYLEKWKE